jgi:hypothetical protein
MPLLDYVRTREYIVTLHNKNDLNSLYDELETQGKSPNNIQLTRPVKCTNRRPSSRNTHYLLTDWEADELRRDPRVRSVTLHPRELGIRPGLNFIEQTSSNWNRSGSTSNTHKNYALLRCTEGEQRAGWGTSFNDASGTITLGPSGKNVDVVICDGDGFNPNHPEFAVNPDGTGGSRAQYYNWFQHDPVVKGTPAGTYVNSPSGSGGYHAIHVMGTVGGNTQGWARKANLYNIYYFAGAVGDDDFPYVMDYIREFHRNKLVNTETGRKNPTIVNNSWGESLFSSEWTFSDITAVTYRGTRYEAPGGTTTYSGLSGVYSSSSLLSNFTGNPENLAQRITTSGSESGTPSAEFGTIPTDWVLDTNQAYLVSFEAPSNSYSVFIDVTSSTLVTLKHNVALGGDSGDVTAQGTISIRNPSGAIVQTYTSDLLSGPEVEVYLEESYTLTTTGTWEIIYETTYNIDNVDNPLFAVALSAALNINAGTAAASVTELTGVSIGSTTGLTVSTTPTNVAQNTTNPNDDAYWRLELPFTITYLGVNYTDVYIGTNMYTTFGGGSFIYSGISASSPALPKIMVGAADNSIQRIYYGVEGTAPNRTFRVIVEGNAATFGTLGTPGMKMQYTFYENAPTQIDLIIAQNNRKTISGGGFSSAQLNAWGFLSGQRMPQRVDALDADIEDAIAEGIIYVGAAGNGYWKHDVPGGIDWNNTFEMANRYPGSVANPYYYMRGTSPTANDTIDHPDGRFEIPNICVGATDFVATERKANFSDCGPGVDIYAPGVQIISSYDSTGSVSDSRNSSFRLSKISGTSMASPQVCGVLACILEIYPHFNAYQAKEYILRYAKNNQLIDGSGGPTDSTDLQGSENLFLFYPLERPTTGNMFPKRNYNVRPATGAVYPRPRIRRSY